MRTRRCADNGHLEFEMWEGSTLDEAIQEQFECKAFVGHRHCQRLIKATFNGNYPRSKLCLKVDEAKHIGDHLMLFIRIMTTIFLIIPFTLGAGVGWLVKLDTPDAWPSRGRTARRRTTTTTATATTNGTQTTSTMMGSRRRRSG